MGLTAEMRGVPQKGDPFKLGLDLTVCSRLPDRQRWRRRWVGVKYCSWKRQQGKVRPLVTGEHACGQEARLHARLYVMGPVCTPGMQGCIRQGSTLILIGKGREGRQRQVFSEHENLEKEINRMLL